MKQIKRKQVIKELVESAVEAELDGHPGEILRTLFTEGCSGYNSATNKELKEEYEALFEEEIKIEE